MQHVFNRLVCIMNKADLFSGVTSKAVGQLLRLTAIMQCLNSASDEVEKHTGNDPEFFPKLKLDLDDTQSQSIRVSEESAGAAIELIDYFLSQAKVLCCGQQDKVNETK